MLLHGTIDVAVFGINYDPIETTTSNHSRDIATREHLPGSKADARAGTESFLDSIGCLHVGRLRRMKVDVDCGALVAIV